MKTGRIMVDGNVMKVEEGADGIVERKEGNYTWLPPIEPTKIIGLALNYREHAEELKLDTASQPVIFLKPNSSLTGHMTDIIYPKGATFVHYEGELAVVIGKKCRYASASNALDYVAGYTIANDVTARDFITNTFRPPVKAKGFDTFCPIGPWLVDLNDIGDAVLRIRTLVNGNVKQDSRTDMMIYSVQEIIQYLSEFMTLYPGDVILTGTPKGIEPLKPGDRVDVEIERIGTLTNFVRQEK